MQSNEKESDLRKVEREIIPVLLPALTCIGGDGASGFNTLAITVARSCLLTGNALPILMQRLATLMAESGTIIGQRQGKRKKYSGIWTKPGKTIIFTPGSSSGKEWKVCNHTQTIP